MSNPNITKYIFQKRTFKKEKQNIQNLSGEFDWWNVNVTNEIYLCTHRSDWWRHCLRIANLLSKERYVIDIGTGDGHTLWQIISAASALDTYGVKKLALIEPSIRGLGLAAKRCSQLSLESLLLYQSTFEEFMKSWQVNPKVIEAPNQYDALYAGHVNYYLGKQGVAESLEKYTKALNDIVRIAKKAIITTVPRDSDYYKIAQPFGDYVYSDVTANHYRSLGYSLEIIDSPVRFYVDHVNYSEHEAILLWKFFNNTESKPTSKDISDFINIVNQIKDSKGNINFKDQILVVTNKNGR